MARSRKATTTVTSVTTDLYVEYDTRTVRSRDRDPNDSWDRGNTHSEHTLKHIRIAKDGNYPCITYPGLVKPGEKVYLVYAVYSTGDSFGHDTDRCLELISVHKDIDIARFNYQKVKTSIAHDYNYTLEISQDNGQVVPVSCPWLGYFESLSLVKVAGFTVRDHAPENSDGSYDDDWYDEYN